MRKHVPNLLTLLNLLSGCIAITLAFKGNFTGVATWVFVAALFDFTKTHAEFAGANGAVIKLEHALFIQGAEGGLAQ